MLTPPGPTSRPTTISTMPNSSEPRTIWTIPAMTRITAMSQRMNAMPSMSPRRRLSKQDTRGSSTTERGLPATRPRALPVVGLGDRLDQLVLAHPGPSAHVEPPGDVHQVRLGRVRVHPTGGRPGPPRGRRRAGRLRVGGTLALLGLPVVADLLVRVLEGGERGAVRPLALPVRLHGRVVRLRPGLLRLLRRAAQGGRQFLLGGHSSSPPIRWYTRGKAEGTGRRPVPSALRLRARSALERVADLVRRVLDLLARVLDVGLGLLPAAL